jgi:hypothetical protein
MDSDARRLLTYDNLPAFSTLRREQEGEGFIITAAAEEPSGYLRRVAAKREFLISAMLTGGGVVMLLFFVGPVLLDRWRSLPGLTAVIVGVFVASGLLLVWQLRYTARLNKLERALQQMTVIAVRPERIVIETKGPFGQHSYELQSDELCGVRVLLNRTGSAPYGERSWLELIRRGGGPIRILPGREPAELQWVARVLRPHVEKEA